MSTDKAIVKVGTTTARVNPENVESIRLQLERASKVPTVKAARAAALKGGIRRKYPKFTEGMSTSMYVRQYSMLNTRQTGYGIQRGSFLSAADLTREDAAIKEFFHPLSTLPMFTPSGEVVEETI